MREAVAAFRKWVRLRGAVNDASQMITVGAIMDRYIENRRIEGKRSDKMVYQWKAMREMFADLEPADLETPRMVDGEMRTICHLYAVKRRALMTLS